MNWVEERGRRLAYFAGCDYLRLSWHPELRAALSGGERSAVSAGASRATTGNLPVYVALERELARFFGVGGAVLTSTGYAAPLVAVQGLAREHTHVLLDEQAHACLNDAALLSGLPVARFPHLDVVGLKAAIQRSGRRARVLVLTDGVWSATGEVTPLGDYLEVIPAGSRLFVDDAHGAGVLGRRGRGTAEWAGLPPEAVVTTMTLSKAFGCFGGAVLASEATAAVIRANSRLYVGNTGIPPSLARAGLVALALMRREGGERRARMRGNAARIREVLPNSGGFGAASGIEETPLVVCAPRGEAEVQRLVRRLRRSGIHPPLIRYPNGPTERFFRFAITSEHEPEMLERLVGVLTESGSRAI